MNAPNNEAIKLPDAVNQKKSRNSESRDKFIIGICTLGLIAFSIMLIIILTTPPITAWSGIGAFSSWYLIVFLSWQIGHRMCKFKYALHAK